MFRVLFRMKLPSTVKIKITGLLVPRVNLRRKIEKGNLTNVWELVFTLPGLGTIPLDDSFMVEIYDMTLPKAERKWVEVSVNDLKKALLMGKYVKKKLSPS
jgi:hypothetical protein